MVFCNLELELKLRRDKDGHNPYFNRWFSAIRELKDFLNTPGMKVTILILIDGFLQYCRAIKKAHNP